MIIFKGNSNGVAFQVNATESDSSGAPAQSGFKGNVGQCRPPKGHAAIDRAFVSCIRSE